ncbi:ABC transporter transmembrane domain-containing protein [Paenibacillus roseipurpureus]|uniref:ABC transporter transmembrane domain-containing protein n=1 Tax=Paenibacillus roseopurpureus TaxID=2918901 RepID=A0AA96LNC3_9BACL|nr:ABC transporter transmembrane domain-containing protein [Paenibacillus sp. MBLB1832]WNR45167.1 ABC transporter transmembrane domain-containing protein [Paenibacillus sp. MBLB1832]
MLYLYRSILRYLTNSKRIFTLFLLALLFELSFEYFTSLSIKYLIDDAITPRNMTIFFALLLALLIGGVLNLVIGVGGDYAMSKLNETILLGLRQNLYEQTQKLSAHFFSRYRIGDIVARFTMDIPAVEHAMMMTFSTLILASLSIVVGTALLFTLEWKLALVAFVGIVFMFIPQKLLNKRAQHYNEEYVGVVESFSNNMDEEMKAFKLIRGFQLQASMKKRFMKQLQVWFRIGVKRSFINSNLERLPIMVLSVINVIILGLGGYFTFQGTMSIGDLIAFYSVFDTVGLSVIQFMEVVPDLIEGEVGIRRINEVLEIAPDLEEGDHALTRASLSKDIKFDGVTFGYTEAQPVIHDLSLSIPVGSYVAIVGASGSGKSTLLQLLMRFYDPQKGAIRIDDTDLRSIQLSSFLQHAGVIFQEPYLFHATIRDNLLIGHPDASDEALFQATRAVGVHDAIIQMSSGYDTWIENDGANLSVSQRHRISIARALLRSQELTFLDEVAASLDPESEIALNETISSAHKGRTVIAASHRLKTVAHADLVYMIDHGRVIEQGTHQELMARQGAYYSLWKKQEGFHMSRDGEVLVDAERLRQLPFFAYMNETLLHEIKDLLRTEKVASGHHVFKQGDAGNKLYIIARGKVAVSKQNDKGHSTRVAVLQDGDHFGEIALLKDAPRNADITALTDCALLTLTRSQLLPLLDRYEDMKIKLNQSLTERS